VRLFVFPEHSGIRGMPEPVIRSRIFDVNSVALENHLVTGLRTGGAGDVV